MKALFEKTKYSKFYILTNGSVLSKTNYLKKSTIKRKLQLNKRGYLHFRTRTKNYQVHRLVASAFIPNPENKPQVNHKNGIKTDNRVENLEWATSIENIRHSITKGFSKLMKKNQGNIKYTNKQCEDVIKDVKKGMTYLKAGSKQNMPYSTVAHLMRGSRRKI